MFEAMLVLCLALLVVPYPLFGWITGRRGVRKRAERNKELMMDRYFKYTTPHKGENNVH